MEPCMWPGTWFVALIIMDFINCCQLRPGDPSCLLWPRSHPTPALHAIAPCFCLACLSLYARETSASPAPVDRIAPLLPLRVRGPAPSSVLLSSWATRSAGLFHWPGRAHGEATPPTPLYFFPPVGPARFGPVLVSFPLANLVIIQWFTDLQKNP